MVDATPIDWTAIFIAKLRHLGCHIPIHDFPVRDMPNGHGTVPTLVTPTAGWEATTLRYNGPKRVRTIEILVQWWFCKICLFPITELANISVTEENDSLKLVVYHPAINGALEEILHVWKQLDISNKVEGMVDDYFLAPTPVEGSTI